MKWLKKRCKLESKNQSQRKTIKMSAAKETKTTTVFNGKQPEYGKYRIQVKGEFMTKGI